MKSILLTTTAIVAFAGAAAADGHVTMTWSGTATAGIAREGDVDVAAGKQTAAGAAAVVDALGDLVDDSDSTSARYADETAYTTALRAQLAADVDTIATTLDDAGSTATTTDGSTAAGIRADVATLRAKAAAANLSAGDLKEINDALDAVAGILDNVVGTAAYTGVTGDFDTYAEVNATVTGSVAMSNGVTVTAAMSVDAGTGYDFADDDGFDAEKTNGVSLDYITIDGGSFGALTFDKNDIEHLVDDDDDETADLKYTNDFGVASFAFVMDIAKDTDVVAAKAGADTITYTDGVDAADGTTAFSAGSAAVAADVAWSAKVSAPVADIATVYAAFDEEGGNAVGGSVTMQGVTITVDSKLEALEEELSEDRSNTIGASYTAGALTVGGSYNTIEDGNQWSINGAYAADGFSVAYSTDEGEEWSATASYAMSDNASIEAGVNYTEDAFVGVSFSF